MIIPPLIYAIAAGADVLTTLSAIRRGASEGNPLIGAAKPSAFRLAAFKAGGAAVVVAIWVALQPAPLWLWWALWLIVAVPSGWAAIHNTKQGGGR